MKLDIIPFNKNSTRIIIKISWFDRIGQVLIIMATTYSFFMKEFLVPFLKELSKEVIFPLGKILVKGTYAIMKLMFYSGIYLMKALAQAIRQEATRKVPFINMVQKNK